MVRTGEARSASAPSEAVGVLFDKAKPLMGLPARTGCMRQRREDVLRRDEMDGMMEKAAGMRNGARLQCIMALLWLFGKRVSEVVPVRKEDVWTDERYFYGRFIVRRKRRRQTPAVAERYLKKIRLDHPYVQRHVLPYLSTLPEKGYIFPSYSAGGHITPRRVEQMIKQINPNAWPHLFRHSLATLMAEQGATEDELMDWFDWDSSGGAHGYVRRAGQLADKWADRAF